MRSDFGSGMEVSSQNLTEIKEAVAGICWVGASARVTRGSQARQHAQRLFQPDVFDLGAGVPSWPLAGTQ